MFLQVVKSSVVRHPQILHRVIVGNSGQTLSAARRAGSDAQEPYGDHSSLRTVSKSAAFAAVTMTTRTTPSLPSDAVIRVTSPFGSTPCTEVVGNSTSVKLASRPRTEP